MAFLYNSNNLSLPIMALTKSNNELLGRWKLVNKPSTTLNLYPGLITKSTYFSIGTISLISLE